ncbi:MAG: hypothetical protein ACE5JJ_11010 [Nitrospinota bacterium]
MGGRLALAGAGLVVGGLFLGAPAPARAGPLVIKTMFMSLELRNGAVAQQVEKRIRIKFRDIRLIRRGPSLNPGGAEAKLADKADKIFLKVQKLLDMRPRRIKVRVLVLRDQSELNQHYQRIFKRKERKYPVSFYVHKYTTVFTHEGVINESILAHELAHAVIDHYFIIMPPRKVQEMLAMYADANLSR